MRPTYSYAMKGVIIGFTGFKEKDDLVILTNNEFVLLKIKLTNS